MNLSQIAQLRLHSQQIENSTFQNARDLVAWMGAMQAQDYAMAKWAVGSRLPDATDASIQAAVDRAEIIRTHLMRPTWHFVAAEDIYWLLELTAPQIRTSLRARHRQLEMDEEVLTKSMRIFADALRDGQHRSRQELAALLEQENIGTKDNRMAHLLLHAELDGLICSGASTGKTQTFALLEERVPQKRLLSREEALAELAQRYFRSHGPGTLADFVWWSGLPVTAAREALELVKSRFVAEEVNKQTYYFDESLLKFRHDAPSVHLLPAFDEYLISYKDRSASITFDNHKEAISINGIFWPIIVVNGEVVGKWKRTIKKNTVILEFQFFKAVDETIMNRIQERAKWYGDFLELEVDVRGV